MDCLDEENGEVEGGKVECEIVRVGGFGEVGVRE